MQGTFDVATAGETADGADVLEAARRVDLFLDWLAMQASSDLSFVLDKRYRALLSDEDGDVADLLERLGDGFAKARGRDGSELDRSVDAFLQRLGRPREAAAPASP